MTATLDNQTGSIELPEEARKEGAVLNRFGVFNMQDNNGKHCEIYLDDLEYSVGE